MTAAYVYHFDITGDTTLPERICDHATTRSNGTSSAVVTSVSMSHNQQWLAIAANQLVDHDIQGTLQVSICVAQSISCCLIAPIGSFYVIKCIAAIDYITYGSIWSRTTNRSTYSIRIVLLHISNIRWTRLPGIIYLSP